MSREAWNTLIVNAKIVTPDAVIPAGYAAVKGGKIEALGPMAELNEALAETAGTKIDARGSWLLPGFIDVHVHGGYGSDFMDGTAESLENITRFHSSQGTTTMLATTVTSSPEAIGQVLESVQAYREKGMPYAQLAGVHLEGPFISPKWPGAQNPNFIVTPKLEWVKEWTERYPGLIRLVTLAPETEGALPVISFLAGQGICVACGHTDSTYAQIGEAVKHGLNHAVHTFNAMKGLHHREPGVVGAVLTEDKICAEVIADGHHVHPACIRLLTQTKRSDNLVLITDAISAAGLGDGDFELGGLAVVVKDGIARLRDGDSLAGSTLTMIGALRYMVNTVGVSVEEASRMASWNPAKQLGLLEKTGSIETGKQADLLLVTPELDLERVWIQGKELSE